jgi:hypothetical protein
MKKIMFFFLLCVSINAQTIYVNSSAGNDATGNGSSGSPYKSFTAGYNAVISGETLDLTGTFTWTDAAETGDNSTSGFTISKNITIQGSSNSTLAIVQAASSSGIADRRVFTLASNVNFKNLEIRYGNLTSDGAGGGGIGCPSLPSSTLNMDNCYIHHNLVNYQGGGIYLSPSTGLTVTIINSTISNNQASVGASGRDGGGIWTSSSVTLTLTNSTIYNNSTTYNGGGLLLNGTSTITNCTIAENSVSAATSWGGGISKWESSTTLYLKNTILANNSASSDGSGDFDLYQGNFTDNGYNIVEHTDASSGLFTGTTKTGDQSNLFGSSVGTTPSLAINNSINGTPTLKTTSGSVAINAGSSGTNNSISVPTTDQRGAGRNGATDIGAYEYWNDSGSLPVELNSFTAQNTGGKIELNWQTATEVNNFGFDVERSSSIQEVWEKIGFVQGHGNSNSPKEYSYTDNPTGGSVFKYRLKQIDIDGKYEYSLEVEVSLNVPTTFSVKQNFPNPFNPTTKIEFSIPSDNNVEIKVFNVLGMGVATLLNEHRQAGTNIVEFNASNLSSGIYFYKIVSGKYSEIKKMILLK